MSQAYEFGWHLLAGETIYRPYESFINGTPSVIRFEVPVNIREINILSPNMYINNSSGGILIGGTDPIRFPVSFYCNNVDDDMASANVMLGELNYEHNICTTLRCTNKIWTNRLVVLGKYSTLTIVVFGTSKTYNTNVHTKSLTTIHRVEY